jgi:hypothetical protein
MDRNLEDGQGGQKAAEKDMGMYEKTGWMLVVPQRPQETRIQ